MTARTPKLVPFFLRFYNLPQADIDACLAEMRPHGAWLRRRQVVVTTSVNPFLPPCDPGCVNAEVRLYFATRAEAVVFRENPVSQGIYMQWIQRKHPTATFARRLPRDAAFRV